MKQDVYNNLKQIIESNFEEYDNIDKVFEELNTITYNFQSYLFENHYQIFDELYMVCTKTGKTFETSELFENFLTNYVKKFAT
jgi:hypothetical protein